LKDCNLSPNRLRDNIQRQSPAKTEKQWVFFSSVVFGFLVIASGFSFTGCQNYTQKTLAEETHPTFTKEIEFATLTRTPEISDSITSTNFSTSTTEITPSITLNPHLYIFPVRPDKSIDFAEGTSSHGYPAIDIFAPEGWEYVAVIDGTVEFVSYKDIWDPTVDDPATRGGIAIAIIGADGIRYYGSHLLKIADGIETGQHVFAGQLLGYIGESGNALGTVSHLHFGISRPTYPEDWKTRRGEIDPFPYLNAWAAGINVTPKYSTPTPKATP
jgi:murein DD-endopeptidase MepM/ murein hydrolase activator NlpD